MPVFSFSRVKLCNLKSYAQLPHPPSAWMPWGREILAQQQVLLQETLLPAVSLRQVLLTNWEEEVAIHTFPSNTISYPSLFFILLYRYSASSKHLSICASNPVVPFTDRRIKKVMWLSVLWTAAKGPCSTCQSTITSHLSEVSVGQIKDLILWDEGHFAHLSLALATDSPTATSAK